MAAPIVGAITSYAAWGFYSRLGLIWGTAYWQFNKVDDGSNQDLLLDSITLASAALATSFVLYPASANVAVGWAVRSTAFAIAKSPVTVAVTAAIVGGAIVSDRIDPVSGYDNYVGFITGGNVRESDIHYWGGDANNIFMARQRHPGRADGKVRRRRGEEGRLMAAEERQKLERRRRKEDFLLKK